MAPSLPERGGSGGRAAEQDPKAPPGRKVSDAERASVRLERADFHGDWIYTILPNPVPATSVPVVP